MNFDKQGDSHKTFIGGFFSVIIKVAIWTYVFYNFKKMLFNESDTNFTQIGLINLEDLGDVQYNQSQLIFFHRLTKQRTGDLDLSDPEMYRYIDIKFVNQFVDWTKPADAGRYTNKYFKARPCEQKDFGTTPDSVDIFHTWDGFTIVCPEIEDGDGFTIKGDLGSMLSKKMNMVVERCNNTARLELGLSECYNKTEIEEYIEDLQVDVWTQFEKINYQEYEGKPIYRVQDIVGSFLMSKQTT